MDKAATEPTRPHLRFDRKNAVIGLLLLVLLLGGGLWYWAANRPPKEPPSKYPQYSEQQLVNAVNKLYGQSKFTEAIELIQAQKTLNDSKTQLLLAGAYANKGDFKNSLAIYDRLDSQNKLNEVYTSAAAETAERDKQYQKAIDYYKKAKQRIDKATSTVDQVQVYDYKITELQKKL